jgi:hypothetical protein
MRRRVVTPRQQANGGAGQRRRLCSVHALGGLLLACAEGFGLGEAAGKGMEVDGQNGQAGGQHQGGAVGGEGLPAAGRDGTAAHLAKHDGVGVVFDGVNEFDASLHIAPDVDVIKLPDPAARQPPRAPES